MITLDADDYEALGYGDQLDALVWSGWAERLKEAANTRARDWQKTPRGRKSRRAAQARYRVTEKGKASQARYASGEKARATMRAYQQTEAGRAAKARANARYRAKQRAMKP